MQAHTSKTGCCGWHCDLEQYMSCLRSVFMYGFCQVLIRSAGRFYFVGALLFCDNWQTHLGVLLSGRALLIGTLRYVPKGPVDNKSSLVQTVASSFVNTRPLPEPMMNQFPDAYINHLEQDCSVSDANTLGILQSCTKLSLCFTGHQCFNS